MVLKWKTDKFLSRYHNLRHEHDSKIRKSILQVDKARKESLYHDTVEPYLIGSAFINLENLAYMIENSAEVNILNNTGSIGKAVIKLVPSDIVLYIVFY